MGDSLSAAARDEPEAKPARVEDTGEIVGVDLIKIPAKLAGAIVKAQGAIKTAALDGRNQHIKAGYSSVNAIIEATIEPMRDAGLGLILESSQDLQGQLALSHVLIHDSGDGLRIRSDIPIEGRGATARGTAESYRYKFLLLQLMKIPRGDPSEEAEEQAIKPKARRSKADDGKPARDLAAMLGEMNEGPEIVAELMNQPEGWTPRKPDELNAAIKAIKAFKTSADRFYNAVLNFDYTLERSDDPDVRRRGVAAKKRIDQLSRALPPERAKLIREDAVRARGAQ